MEVEQITDAIDVWFKRKDIDEKKVFDSLAEIRVYADLLLHLLTAEINEAREGQEPEQA